MELDKEKCPCCGNYTIPKGTTDNSYSCGFICPVCYWEIDTFISSNFKYSDSNSLALKQAKENYKTFGACDKKMLKYVRKPTNDEKQVIKLTSQQF